MGGCRNAQKTAHGHWRQPRKENVRTSEGIGKGSVTRRRGVISREARSTRYQRETQRQRQRGKREISAHNTLTLRETVGHTGKQDLR